MVQTMLKPTSGNVVVQSMLRITSHDDEVQTIFRATLGVVLNVVFKRTMEGQYLGLLMVMKRVPTEFANCFL